MHLLLLAILATLSSGFDFEAKVTGTRGPEECAGDEYDGFKKCVATAMEEEAAVRLTDHSPFDKTTLRGGGERKLNNYCSGCPPDPHQGSFCLVYCGSGGRRRLLSLEVLPQIRLTDVQVITGKLASIKARTMALLKKEAAAHPCLGSPEDFDLDITVYP